jgi:hypothetical protein
MIRAYIAAIASVAVFVAGAACAAPGTAPFGCNAASGQTCFFKLFLGPRNTRVVQLPSGMTANVPGVNIGVDRYCVSTKTPPLPTCAPTAVKATLNY